MMVDGITFDVGSVSSPIFAMPDASGLAPLSLPEAFLEKQRTIAPQTYSDIKLVKPSAEAVSRFEAAMCENLLPVNLARINNLIERGMSPAIAKTVVAANEGTVPVKVGTDPIPQKVVVAEKGIETPVSPSLREDVVVAEPVAPKGTVPDTTPAAPVLARGTDPAPDVVKAGTDPIPDVVKAGTGPVKEVADSVKVGTDPVPQKVVVAEKGIETPVSPSLREDVVVAEPVAPKGTAPETTPAAPVLAKGTDPAPDVVKAGTVPVKEVADSVKVGTDPIPQKVVVAEKGIETPASPVLHEDVAVAGPVAPKGTGPDNEIKVVGARNVVDVNETVEVDEEVEPAQAQALQAVPVSVAAAAAGDVQVELQAQEVSAVSAASARTEAVVDTVNNLVEAVVSQISVTPSLIQGEGEVRMTLKANVLDGSDIMLSSKDGTLSVVVTPATPEAAQAAAAAMPRLEVALAEHAPAFRQVAVKLVARKGTVDETA